MTTSTSDRVDIRPQPKQEAFLASPADIAIFGGGAGGGRTYLPKWFAGHQIPAGLFHGWLGEF